MATAIEFNHVSKQYRLGLVSTCTLSHDLDRWFQTSILRREDPYLKIGEVNDRASKGSSEYVWALRDIDFKVEQGDVVGIIGKNGAGKSTLLKLLSKVTAPTTGTIRARGRIASLLEVGTGFHQEMTGRENIYMNGAILGMTKQEITSKLDEIVAFSGCERYLDTPVKRYSSGMMVRLGFAVAAHLDPEILVVDEVLAVGDAEFQKKAIGKMQDISHGEGRTVLFVSHNMGSVRQLCKTGVLLENGTMRMAGNIDEVVDTYMHDYVKIGTSLLDSISYQAKYIKINKVLVNGSDNNHIHLTQQKHSLVLFIEGRLAISQHIAIEMRLFDMNKMPLAIYSPSHYCGYTKLYDAGNILIEETIHLPENMNNGTYYVSFYLTDPNKVYHIKKCLFALQIMYDGYTMKTGLCIKYRGNGFLFLE